LTASDGVDPMVNPKPGTSDVERWSWILLLLDAAEQAGLTPIDVGQFHRLAYFANCLSPVYDLPVAEGKVMKFVRGPHFTDVQWDLDRLYVMGKVDLRSFEPFHDENGWWFRASYVLNSATIEDIDRIRVSPRLARVHDFQVELAFAYAHMSEEEQETSSNRDVTYADPLVPEGELIDYAEWDEEKNYTEQTVESMSRYLPRDFRVQPRDRIHLYFRYLTRVEPVRMERRVAAGGGSL
jgi:hypothetical protein